MVLRCLSGNNVNVVAVVGEKGEFIDQSLGSSSSIDQRAMVHDGSSPRCEVFPAS